MILVPSLSKINKWIKQLVLNWYQSNGWILTNAWGLRFDYNVEKSPHRTQSKNCWTELLGRSQIWLDLKARINLNFIRNLLYKLAQNFIYQSNSIQHFETSRGYFFIFLFFFCFDPLLPVSLAACLSVSQKPCRSSVFQVSYSVCQNLEVLFW